MNLTPFLRLFVADIFPAKKDEGISKSTEVVKQGWLQINVPYIVPDEEAETSYDYDPSQRTFELEDTARLAEHSMWIDTLFSQVAIKYFDGTTVEAAFLCMEIDYDVLF